MFVTVIVHSIAILVSTLIPWIWTSFESTKPYSLQLAGGLMILYITTKKVLRLTNHETSEDIATLLITNSLIQLLVLSTGGTQSPLFFLFIFLLFAVAIVFEATQATTIAISTSILYLWKSNLSLDINTLSTIFVLLISTPLAITFSKNYLANLQTKGKIKILEDNLQKDETDSLLWISTQAKPSLNSIVSATSDLIIYLNSTRHNLSIPKALLDKLKSIQTDLLVLYSSTEELEESISESADKK